VAVAKLEQRGTLSQEELRDFFREMLLIRRFEEKVEERFRAGELPGFLHVAIGQEAVAVGVCRALEDGDVIASTHRAHGHTLAKGTHPNELMAELYGKAEGCSHGYGGSMHLYDLSRGNLGANAVVGGGLPAVTGAGLAFKLRKEPRVAVCMFGDGATSKGDVYEAMNFAGVHKLPVVFVATNNQWAISVPLRLQTASETLAQKAIAAGFTGEQVDGSDVVAVRAAAEEAIAAARDGQGPRFIEAVTYRLGDHTTSDDASRYRPEEEVQARWKEEPIARLRAFLAGQKMWSKADEEQLAAECHERVEAAVERYLATEPRRPEPMFDHLYADLPEAYVAQRRQLAGEGDV